MAWPGEVLDRFLASDWLRKKPHELKYVLGHVGGNPQPELPGLRECYRVVMRPSTLGEQPGEFFRLLRRVGIA